MWIIFSKNIWIKPELTCQSIFGKSWENIWILQHAPCIIFYQSSKIAFWTDYGCYLRSFVQQIFLLSTCKQLFLNNFFSKMSLFDVEFSRSFTFLSFITFIYLFKRISFISSNCLSLNILIMLLKTVCATPCLRKIIIKLWSDSGHDSFRQAWQ